MCWGEDSTVPIRAAVGVVFGSLWRVDADGTYMSLSGGAFLQFHAKAMTDQMTSASVCDLCGQVSGCVPSGSYACVIAL